MLACIKYIKMETEKKVETEYINSLTEIEKKGYEIAKSHLGSSFSLKKSIFFLRLFVPIITF